jgi:iron complex transport system ATP-binding protein
LTPRERARRVSYLPQGHVAYWPITAREVVALGRYPHGLVDPSRLSSADAASVDEAMALTGTSAFAARRVTDLSGGERARVALARVVVGGAAIILADEPTAALDPLYQLEIMALLRTLANRGALVLAVTHDLTLAARHADEVLVLEGRRLAPRGDDRRSPRARLRHRHLSR